ncbi:MAG: thiamine pyrophosphate-binding protein, partial [Planctomycetota bacterium]
MGIGLRKRGQQRSGGAVIAEMLAAEGVRHVFGIIDGSYFGLYSALEPAGIRLIGPRHEASAAHMAGAYARLTGGLGVCMASNGPGVANMLTGIAVEHTEGNRVLVITSCRRTGACSPDRGGTFQCFPHTAVTGPITRWAATVPSAERLPEMVRKALRAAWAGRPGVVHLDVPEDILNGTHAFPSERGWAPERYRALEGPQPSPAQLDRALAMLLEAERPMLHVGAGVVHARAFEPLARVAEALQLPVTTSWPGRSAYPETSPLSVPLTHIETHRTVRNEADCVLTLGSRLAETDWWGKPPYWRDPAEQRMIQVDIEPSSIGLHKPVDLGIVADVGAFLHALAERLEHSPPEIDLAARRDWLESIARARAKERARLERLRRQRADGVHSARLVALTRELTARDAIVVLDGGNTAVWGQFFYELREPNTLLTTWKMGM